MVRLRWQVQALGRKVDEIEEIDPSKPFPMGIRGHIGTPMVPGDEALRTLIRSELVDVESGDLPAGLDLDLADARRARRDREAAAAAVTEVEHGD